MTTLEWLEALSYMVTIIGLPFAIAVFLKEQRKERQNDDEDLYLQLSEEYAKFLRLVLDHADLHLITRTQPATPFTSEQIERRNVLFELLISIFERAYILVYEDQMGHQATRLWQTWVDYMRDWCRRPDFRELLPTLLQGEDPEFQNYIRQIAEEETNPSDMARSETAEVAPRVFGEALRHEGDPRQRGRKGHLRQRANTNPASR